MLRFQVFIFFLNGGIVVRIIDMPRATGKTSLAINLALEFNCPLLVKNKYNKKYIKYLCEKDNYNFEKLRLYDVTDLINKEIPDEEIIIDDFDSVMEEIFKRCFCTKPKVGFKSTSIEDLVFWEEIYDPEKGADYWYNKL